VILVYRFDVAVLCPCSPLAVKPRSGAGNANVEDSDGAFLAIWYISVWRELHA
jgi:hypothetical protein